MAPTPKPDPSNDPFAGSPFLREAALVEQRVRLEDVDTLAADNATAVEYCVADRYADALPLLEWAASVCGRVLGPRHPDTLIVEGNLAVGYLNVDRWGEGMALLQANLAGREHVLGDEHPATLAARDATACALRRSGQLTDAAALASRVTTQRIRVLGPAHHDTLTSRQGLALVRADQDDHETAANLLAAALADAATSAGSDGELILLMRANLADCQHRSGRTAQAIAGLQGAVRDATELLGADHADTHALRGELNELMPHDRTSPAVVEQVASRSQQRT